MPVPNDRGESDRLSRVEGIIEQFAKQLVEFRSMLKEAVDRSHRPTNWAVIVAALAFVTSLAAGYTNINLRPVVADVGLIKQTQRENQRLQLEQMVEMAEWRGRSSTWDEVFRTSWQTSSESRERLSALEEAMLRSQDRIEQIDNGGSRRWLSAPSTEKKEQ